MQSRVREGSLGLGLSYVFSFSQFSRICSAESCPTCSTTTEMKSFRTKPEQSKSGLFLGHLVVTGNLSEQNRTGRIPFGQQAHHIVQLQRKCRTGSALACSSFWWKPRWIWSIRFVRCYHFVERYCQLILLKK